MEYYNGYYYKYNMPNLKYLETSKLLSESEYLKTYPKLTTIITNDKPNSEFNIIKLIEPNKSDISLEYYNKYFNLK